MQTNKNIIIFAGDIPFWEYSEELAQIEQVLNLSQYINSDSIQFWHPVFYNACCGINPELYCLDAYDWNGEQTCEEGK